MDAGDFTWRFLENDYTLLRNAKGVLRPENPVDTILNACAKVIHLKRQLTEGIFFSFVEIQLANYNDVYRDLMIGHEVRRTS